MDGWRSGKIVSSSQGGANAGHTIYDEAGTKYALHLVPSGILNPKTICVVGNGVVMHLPTFFKEIEGLKERWVGRGGKEVNADMHAVAGRTAKRACMHVTWNKNTLNRPTLCSQVHANARLRPMDFFPISAGGSSSRTSSRPSQHPLTLPPTGALRWTGGSSSRTAHTCCSTCIR